jgi:sulfur-oxidizing protein SoxZ
VLRADLFPAIAANPFLSFAVTARESGLLRISFTDDHGVEQSEMRSITVT